MDKKGAQAANLNLARLKAFKMLDLWVTFVKECKSLTDEEYEIVEQTFKGVLDAMEKREQEASGISTAFTERELEMLDFLTRAASNHYDGDCYGVLKMEDLASIRSKLGFEAMRKKANGNKKDDMER